MPYAPGAAAIASAYVAAVHLPGGFFAAEHETGGVSAGEPGEESCEVLAAPSLRIGHGLHGFGDLRSKKVSRRAAPGVASSALIPPAA
jgi:hypothetical protein